MSERVNEWVDEWVKSRVRIDEWVSEWKLESASKWVSECLRNSLFSIYYPRRDWQNTEVRNYKIQAVLSCKRSQGN